MNFVNTVKHFSIQQKLFSNGDRVLVGVSGGPDSTALLYALYELRHFFGLQIYVVHLNHGLRKESAAEQSYVKDLSRKLGLPFFTKTIKLKKTKASLEELAREARLEFLTDIAKKIKADSIALGHHQGDLAETVLMRILRGAGPMGIRSILPKRTINKIVVVRPLLTTNRCAVEKFLKNRKIKFFVDASNRDKKFLRNKIRLDLLPRLQREYNPNIKETLAHLSQALTYSYDYIRSESEKILKKIASGNASKGSIRLDSKKIDRLHPAILREIIRLTLEKLLSHTRRLTFDHIQEVENLIKLRPSHSIVRLPFSLRVEKKENTIIFIKEHAKHSA